MTPIARADIVAEARRWIGTPFAHQASIRQVGCDCLGLARGVWRAMYGAEPEETPPYGSAWASASRDELLLSAAHRHFLPIARDSLRAGDIALFRMRDGLPVAHVAIVISRDNFIHAHSGACVADVAFAPWWRRRLVAAFSFPGLID